MGLVTGQLTSRAHAAGRRIGFDHCDDGTGDAHVVLDAEKKAATATVQVKPEPQGGLGAVDSLVGRGRMGGIFLPSCDR